jgi:pimeloyl-ACP methyl ester carboxylesterase
MTAGELSIMRNSTWTVETVQVCGHDLSFQKGGGGTPLLLLPRENGHPPRHEFLDLLAADFTVYYPWLPGFHGGHPDGWQWLTNVRDLAIVQRQLVEALHLQHMTLLGLGFGGWVAAELATMAPDLLERLVLVAPMGVQPANGYIYDQFIVGSETYARAAFSDQAAFDAVYSAEPGFDQLESWETDREMTSRLAWKPYMYNPTLPGLLAGVAVPTLIIWGDGDQIVPAECGETFRASMPNALLEVVPRAGHAVDVEQPRALAARAAAFCKNAR